QLIDCVFGGTKPAVKKQNSRTGRSRSSALEGHSAFIRLCVPADTTWLVTCPTTHGWRATKLASASIAGHTLGGRDNAGACQKAGSNGSHANSNHAVSQ